MKDELTTTQKNVLTGLMLGDGHICKRFKNSNGSLSVHRSIEDFDYLEYQAELFKEYITPFGMGIYSNKFIYNGIEKLNTQCYFRTYSLELFKEYHSLWYPMDKKIVPSNLILNTEIIAHWFLDDGWAMHRNNKGNSLFLGLSTDCFSRDEVEFLKGLLMDRYNEKFLTTKTTDGNYSITASNDAARAFFKDIDGYVKDFLPRKSTVWRNEKIKLYETKKRTRIEKAVIGFILKTETFTINSLGKEFNTFERRILNSGKITVRASKGQYQKYIKKYIDEGFIKKELVKNENIYTITSKGKNSLVFTP